MAEFVTTLDRNNLRIHKYQKRAVSDIFYNNSQTAASAEAVYNKLSSEDIRWMRSYDFSENLVNHSYVQPLSDVTGDAYAIVAGFGEESKQSGTSGSSDYDKGNYSRRIAEAMSCHTIVVPDELSNPDKNINNADFGDLSITVYGDQWLSNGCILAAFFSDSETPPAYGDLLVRMKTPGGELEINGYFAGYLGSAPDDPNAIRYMRTGVICNTDSQNVNYLSDREPEQQPLIFKLHEWGVAPYNPQTGKYTFKPYIHLMLFLDPQQYVSVRDAWVEGSAMLGISTISLTITEPIECPVYLKDVCSIDSVNSPQLNDGGTTVASDLQGKLFSLVNVFKMLDSQASKLSKANSDLCTWQAIESAVKRVKKANAIYGFGQYPPATASGFDFYVIDVDGVEYVRIGSIDENAMNFSSDIPSPSVYSLVVGYPVNPGIDQRTFMNLMITESIKEFSGAVTLSLVIYQAFRGSNKGTDGSNYGFNSTINKNSFDCVSFFNGTESELTLEDGEKVSLKKAYFGYFTEIPVNERIPFDFNMVFDKPGAIIIGICPIDFTRHGQMADGGWETYKAAGYGSQYMQLVEWPLSKSVMVEELE